MESAPLPFATVAVKNIQRGVTADAEGRYEIGVTTGQVLVFSYSGYQSREQIVGVETEINATLEPGVNTLNDVVVVGYGEQSRSTLTTSVSKLDPAALKNVPFANAATALQGTVAGLRVQSTSGQPGAAPRIIVRGGTSINNPNGAAPLYIVDGIIRADLNDINPDNITNLQVLKDAAATAIYGARGANGVVLVTTKSGTAGRSQISYRYNLGFSQVNRLYDIASARDFIYFNRLGIAATGQANPAQLARLTLPTGSGTGNDLTNRTAFTTQFLTPQNEYKLREGWQSMPDPLDPTKTIIFQETNWQDVLFQTGVTQNHYLSFSGGTEKARLNAGVGFLTDEGIAIKTGFRRFNADVSGDLKVRDNISAFARVNFSNSSDNQVFNINQIFERSIGLPPTAKLYYEDGTLAPGQNRGIGNPLYHLDRLQNRNNLNRLTLSAGGYVGITPELSFEPLASLYVVQGITNSFQASFFNTPTQFVNTRDATAAHSMYWQKQFDGVFTYTRRFGRHNVQAKAGGSYYDRQNYSLSAAGRGASTDLIPTLNAASTPVSVSSFVTNQLILGYFGRVTYDYDGKYLLAINARYDGASNLGERNKWGLFPGVSLGWNLHREAFWAPYADVVSALKLRASYGVNGNIGGLGDFQAQGQYQVGAIYNGNAAIQNQVLENQNLQWERSSTVDLGLDLGLARNRVNVVFDYYRRVTDNLLTNLELPQYTGFTSLLTNLGSLENKGVELELNASLLAPENPVKWTFGVVAAYNQNKILKLPPNGNPNNRVGGILIYDRAQGRYVWGGGLQEGQPIGNLYGYQQLSIYSTDEQARTAPLDLIIPLANKTKYGGDVNWLDNDRNDTIDTRDRVYMGNIYPKWTGGFNTSVSYKNLSLYARTDFALGHTIYNYPRAQFVGQFQGDIAINTEVLRSWQRQGDVTDVPRYYWADQTVRNNLFRAGTGGNSRFFERGDYLAIREITLSYNLPSALLERLHLGAVRLYATGTNLHYFTAYQGLLPEDGGEDRGRYPVPRSVIFGLNLTF